MAKKAKGRLTNSGDQVVVTVEVTENDIKRGRYIGDPTKCPVALAFRRVLKKGYEAEVYSETFLIRAESFVMSFVNKSFVSGYSKYKKFVDDVDCYKDVKPFKFSVELPRYLVKQTAVK